MGDDERIRQNVATMRAKGATDDEVEHYLSKVEGLAPIQKAASPSLDQRRSRESTGVTRRAPDTSPSAAEGVLDAGLNSLTFGLHQKGLGAAEALGDVLSHGMSSHPINTYNRSNAATRARIAAATQKLPTATAASEAAGFFAPLALAGPARAALGFPEAVQAAQEAGGIRAAFNRVGKNATLGGATGAGLTGISSDSQLEKRPLQMVAGGLLGGLLGGAGTAAAEGIGASAPVIAKTFRSAKEKGSEIARRQIVERLAAGSRTPASLINAAREANAVGSPAVAAHLGGPALDDLTYLGASSMTPSGAALKESLLRGQRGEADVIHHGVTAVSGRERLPRNTTQGFTRELSEGRAAAGERDYPIAYREPPIENAEVLDIIRNDPDLRASLGEGLDIIAREDELRRIETGQTHSQRTNPLDVHVGDAEPTETGRRLIEMGIPEERVREAGHFTEPADAPALPIKLIDYTKRGVEPVIQRKVAREGLQSHDADIIRAKVQNMLRRVDAERPSYQDARARQSLFFGREEGAKAGAQAFDRTENENRAAMQNLVRPGQQEAYRTTGTSNLRDKIDALRFSNDIGATLFDTPEMQGTLDVVYGPGARERLNPYLEQGGTLNRVLRAATGGSQTEPRMAVRAAVKEASGTGAAKAITAPHRNLFNIPGKIADAHERRVQQALSETLARELNIPANSPFLPGLVDRLLLSGERGRSAPQTTFGPALSGRLSAALGGQL